LAEKEIRIPDLFRLLPPKRLYRRTKIEKQGFRKHVRGEALEKL